MPKYCIRSDGAVYNYTPELAMKSNFKVVDELPRSHVVAIESAKGRVDSRIAAARAMRRMQDDRQAQRRADTEAVRQRIAEKPDVDSEESEEAQRQAEEFTGEVGAAEGAGDAEFLIGTADKASLIAFAKENFDVDLPRQMKVENLRRKVAELAGVQSSG